jgi:hypothetical protein
LGVVFKGPDPLDGAAILDEGAGFGVSGYSAPNFLAFNSSSILSDGGVPGPPEEILFFGHASYVEIFAGSLSGAGNPLTMMAYDADGVLVGSDDLILGAALQPLTITANHIARVVIDSPATAFVLDDLTFVPEAVPEIMDFDDEPQPALFSNTTALRDDYSYLGILFDGPGPLDGGAILDETSSFLVEGYSPPNHLSFSKIAMLSDGGIPRPPETVHFATPLSAIQIYAGSGGGVTGIVTMEAFDEFGASLGSDSVPIEPLLQPLTIVAEGIVRVEIDHDDNFLVVDDMLFIRQDIVTIDFDDAVQPPLFADTAALRDEYLACEVRFNPDVLLDGGAILDQASAFGVLGFSPRNFLAFNSAFGYPGGGIAGPPERIQFLRPAAFVQMFAGSAQSGIVRARAFAADDTLLEESVINTATEMQQLAITADLIDHVEVTSTVPYFVIDDLSYVLVPTYEIAGRVWHDVNQNGIQDTGEPGFNGATVDLYDSNDCSDPSPMATAVSGSAGPDGSYAFSNLIEDTYCLQVSDIPDHWVFSPQNQGADDSVDSDAEMDGRIVDILLTEDALHMDAGIMQYKIYLPVILAP